MKSRYCLLLFLIAAFAVTSCSDDKVVEDEMEVSDKSGNDYDGTYVFGADNYTLDLVVTLDRMGGKSTRAIGNLSDANPMEEIESYVDPDKLRVLFFDHKDKFLFESRSRWIRKLDPSAESSRWHVSVPVFTYGNDIYTDNEKEEYDWELIREALTSNSFKIAILANRPELDYFSGWDRSGEIPPGWYDNRGPFWGPDDTGKKDVFDLHHSQPDPIYYNKSDVDGYYSFIMGDWSTNRTLSYWSSKYKSKTAMSPDFMPTMGSTSIWIDVSQPVQKSNNSQRYPTRMPTESYPIPMYGIQRFPAIPKSSWKRGTAFNLSNGIPGASVKDGYDAKSVFLLRSVVRIELLIPTSVSKPTFVTLCYPNVNARCEPMDVWTPTDSLWNVLNGDHENSCEWKAIANYGPISGMGTLTSKNVTEYQKRISWFYGVWKDKNWDFTPLEKSNVMPATTTTPYPRIFNSVVQRNAQVIVAENLSGTITVGDLTGRYNDGYYHYVAYTGERNINDPSALDKIDDGGSGKPTVIYWMFNVGSLVYGIPITDYEKSGNPALSVTTDTYTNGNNYPVSHTYVNNTYMNTIVTNTQSGKSNLNNLPWPLIRNHVYQIIMGKKGTSRSSNGSDNESLQVVSSSNLHSGSAPE